MPLLKNKTFFMKKSISKTNKRSRSKITFWASDPSKQQHRSEIPWWKVNELTLFNSRMGGLNFLLKKCQNFIDWRYPTPKQMRYLMAILWGIFWQLCPKPKKSFHPSNTQKIRTLNWLKFFYSSFVGAKNATQMSDPPIHEVNCYQHFHDGPK